ncbi:MAG: hypothetical protein KKF44_08370 [Nanoarchaeota archaeon]|nr:hypothetical protein [Nanoarchaeota archaeon]
MKFKINKEILDKYPDLVIGVLAAKNIDNTDKHEGYEVMKLLYKLSDLIKENNSSENLSENPKIKAWREAYSSFGAKPKKYKSSVENLYRMILGGKQMPNINNLVNIYNYISIRNMVPIGGDDMDRIEGDIELTLAKGDEKFMELNSSETRSPKPGEVIYRDDVEATCRRWNWRECDKTKMTEETKNVMLVAEGLPPVGKEEIMKVLQELGELVKKVCGGEIKAYVLDKELSEVEI